MRSFLKHSHQHFRGFSPIIDMLGMVPCQISPSSINFPLLFHPPVSPSKASWLKWLVRSQEVMQETGCPVDIIPLSPGSRLTPGTLVYFSVQEGQPAPVLGNDR